MYRKRPRLRWLVLVAVLALVAAACGEDAEPAPPTAAPATAAPTTAAPTSDAPTTAAPTTATPTTAAATTSAPAETPTTTEPPPPPTNPPPPTTEPGTEIRRGGSLDTFTYGDPGGFDLHMIYSRSGHYAVPVFNNLVTFSLLEADASVDNLVGDLATAWTVSNDGLEYTFTLAEGVAWHDGEAFDADDVVYSLAKMADPERSALASTFAAFERAEKVDSYTVKLILSAPSPSFLLQLGGPYAVMQAEHLAGTDGKSTDFLVGTGPWLFKDYQEGVSLEFERNPNYYKQGLPYIDTYTRFILGDGVEPFLSGRLDISQANTVDEIEQIKDAIPGAQFYPETTPSTELQWFNMNVAPTDDIRIRRAISLVMEPEELATARLGSLEVVHPGGIFGPGWALSAQERNTLSGMARPFEDRLAEARRLIADAGLSEGFTLKLLFPTGAGGIYERTFAVIADRLERFLPVTVESIALPRAEMRDRRASGDWHIASEFVYELLGDPQGWAGYFTTTGVSNFTGYSNPVVDNLFTEQAQALDPAERARLVQEIERLVVVDQPVMPWGDFYTTWRVWQPNVMNNLWNNTLYGPQWRAEEVWIDE